MEGARTMSDEEEAGSDKVTVCTRAFEEVDARVLPGPGRGATPSEVVDRGAASRGSASDLMRQLSYDPG